MIALIPGWLQRSRREDPRRMALFREQLKDLHWDRPNVMSFLSKLFAAVDYYRRRNTRAWISGVCRFVAWALGSVGLLLPLLAGTSESLKEGAKYGYAFLAGAASFLAANSLFGVTDGHVRFVITQLELEKLVTSSRVAWCEFLARVGISGAEETDEDLVRGFALIQTYAESLHTVTISEAGLWGKTLLAELVKFQKTIGSEGTADEKRL
jgi:hypothetical protein